jgi:hypothetical protein
MKRSRLRKFERRDHVLWLCRPLDGWRPTTIIKGRRYRLRTLAPAQAEQGSVVEADGPRYAPNEASAPSPALSSTLGRQANDPSSPIRHLS